MYSTGISLPPFPDKGKPTVEPAKNFNPQEDARGLRKAMKGLGTDEKAIIKIMCRRSNAQRLEIAKAFTTLFGRNLVEDLKSELSGRFLDLMLALLTPSCDYYARQLKEAVKGLGTDERCIIDIMCSFTNEQIIAVKDAYEKLFNTTLERDLANDTSGYFKKMLISLCSARRNETPDVDEDGAMADAQRLYAAVSRLGTDEATFNEIMCTRSYPQLLQVFKEYENISGNSIETAINKEFSGNIKDGLLAIVQCVRSKTTFFAERLHHSMKGLGTDDKTLIRTVVTHCEVDMAEIKEDFYVRYGKSLESYIVSDTSGDYKKSLLALIGE